MKSKAIYNAQLLLVQTPPPSQATGSLPITQSQLQPFSFIDYKSVQFYFISFFVFIIGMVIAIFYQ